MLAQEIELEGGHSAKVQPGDQRSPEWAPCGELDLSPSEVKPGREDVLGGPHREGSS